MDIGYFLKLMTDKNASDMFLTTGAPVHIKVEGKLYPLGNTGLPPGMVKKIAYSLMDEGQVPEFERDLELNMALSLADAGRFRVNVFKQRGEVGMVIRAIRSVIPSIEELQLPQALKQIIMAPRGLVLIVGSTGSGKSTTLAAMVDYVNETEYGHILTIEDPIEFVHESKRCLINQREVSRDTQSFNAALRSSLREDPDVILVGEMRDLETIRLALTAAETGHLVFGTLHTSSAAKTIDRIVDVFPAAEKDMVRAMMSESLRAVISQTLLKTKDGTGRVAAHEIMIGTPAIRNLIRENKVAQMYSAIQTGQGAGMQTLDQCLADLVRRNIVSGAEARLRAANKDNFQA